MRALTDCLRRFSKQYKAFFLILLTTITLTRIYSVSAFYILGSNEKMLQRVVEDSWHHYHIGLVVLFLAFLFRKRKIALKITAVGLGIVFEEWPIVLNDLGLKTKDIYHTKIDFIAIIGLVAAVFYLFHLKNKKSYD